MAGEHPLSRPVSRRPSGGDAGVLFALLWAHPGRASARDSARGSRAAVSLASVLARPKLPRPVIGFTIAGAGLLVLGAVALAVGRFPVTIDQLLRLLWSAATGQVS